jgi:hypothetical protein
LSGHLKRLDKGIKKEKGLNSIGTCCYIFQSTENKEKTSAKTEGLGGGSDLIGWL